MKQQLESFVNDITMYRLITYVMIAISAMSLILSAAGIIDFPVIGLMLSMLILVSVSYAVSRLAAWTFDTTHNRESWLITALIIFLIVPPVTDAHSAIALAAVAVIAMASKYVLAVGGKHIFNPAAIAVVIASTIGITSGLWWVGTPLLLPVVAIGGLLVAAKTRRYYMIASFLFAAATASSVLAFIQGFEVHEVLKLDILSGPMIFFATIMLTEPLTSPGTRKWQIIYAVVVGVLYSSQITWLSAPATALIIGNLLTFAMSQRQGSTLTIKSIENVGANIHSITTQSDSKIKFTAGQFVEISLPHDNVDSRGIRRTFSIASRPGADTIDFGVVIGDESSSFKRALAKAKLGSKLHITQLGGDFVLPKDTDQPILMIAGGIGITPFRSMLEDLLERNEQRDVTLVYAVRSEDALAYQDVINQATHKLGLKYIPVIASPSSNWLGESGFASPDLIKKHVPDLSGTTAYISGPPVMVNSLTAPLKKLGAKKVVTDLFTGY